MRTDEWQHEQDGMISTALVEVLEPGDPDNPMSHDVVLLGMPFFEEVMADKGFVRVSTP